MGDGRQDAAIHLPGGAIALSDPCSVAG